MTTLSDRALVRGLALGMVLLLIGIAAMTVLGFLAAYETSAYLHQVVQLNNARTAPLVGQIYANIDALCKAAHVSCYAISYPRPT